MPQLLQRLQAAFPDAEAGMGADGHPYVRLSALRLMEGLRRVHTQLGFTRFVDLTVVDDPARRHRFELNYLLYSMADQRWIRVKARTTGTAPSAVALYPAANWYEREAFDLFGVQFEGHPDLTRILMPDDWQGHPLRRDEPVGGEPVDFTVTREIYGT